MIDFSLRCPICNIEWERGLADTVRQFCPNFDICRMLLLTPTLLIRKFSNNVELSWWVKDDSVICELNMMDKTGYHRMPILSFDTTWERLQRLMVFQ